MSDEFDDSSSYSDYFDNSDQNYYSDGSDTQGYGNDTGVSTDPNTEFDFGSENSVDIGSGLSLDESSGQTDLGIMDWWDISPFTDSNLANGTPDQQANAGTSKDNSGESDIYSWLDDMFKGDNAPNDSKAQDGATVNRSGGSGSGFSIPTGGSSGGGAKSGGGSDPNSSIVGQLAKMASSFGASIAALQSRNSLPTQTAYTNKKLAASSSAPISGTHIVAIVVVLGIVGATIIYGQRKEYA